MVTKLIPLSFFLLFLLCFSRLVLSRFINEIADKVGEWVVLKKEELRKLLKRYPNDINLSEMLDELRVLCANEKSNDVLKILDDVLEISKSSSNLKFKVNLYELRIKQLCRFKENLQSVEEFLEEMTQTARSINYVEGLALSFQIRGYIQLLKGDRESSDIEINRAVELLNNSEQTDSYTYIMCNYSYAISRWLSSRDFNIANTLEECFEYFYLNNYYHGLAMSLGVLIIIYQQTQNKERSMQLIRRILNRRDVLLKMPEEIQSIVHYFIGVGHKLCFNISEAENYLQESQNILKSTYKKSIYSGYYLRSLAHLTACYALQGRLELALIQIKEVEDLIEEGIATKNLDTFSKRQTEHDFNLTKFYIHSRLQNFQIEDLQELVQKIIENIEKQHSDAIFFSEFLLNATLTKKQLLEIKSLNNPSTKRVEHILNFLIEKTSHVMEHQTIKFISILKRRPVVERMTFVEKAYADLLAAQEYYQLYRFAEIYPLLKKYENQLYKIEVLEMRVFMEAFIQVGAYKNGDPLGPALQYMAIKKCRQYGFSRLENKLSDYLTMQGNDTIRMML